MITRRIRFRAWNHLQKMMLNASDVSSMPMDNTLVAQPSNDYGTTYMQATGFRDKDGREIYEGDLLDNWGEEGVSEIMPIIFHHDIGQWYWGDGTGNSLPLHELDPMESLVVGDVFRNPELLV